MPPKSPSKFQFKSKKQASLFHLFNVDTIDYLAIDSASTATALAYYLSIHCKPALDLRWPYNNSKMSESNNKDKARRRWTEEEDNKLRCLVAEQNDANQIVWRDIATKIVTRNSEQCRERWTNHLRPGIRKGDWSFEEDETIQRMQKEIGNQWSTIASKLNSRTDHDVKNRHRTLLRRSSKRKSADAMPGPVPKVGMKVLVKFEEDGYNKLYDGTITQVDSDEEQPDTFLLQIQYEDGSYEDDCRYPDGEDIYLVDCRSSNDSLTEEEVSLSSELLNIHYSLLSSAERKKQACKNEDQDYQKTISASAKENHHTNLTDRR